MAAPKRPPYPFILDAVASLSPEIRRMFSGFAIYSGNLLILMLRDHATSSLRDNGLWLVLSETTLPHDPTLRRIELLGDKIHHWLLIPSDSPTFETEALHACDLLLRRDPRLGRIPKSRR